MFSEKKTSARGFSDKVTLCYSCVYINEYLYKARTHTQAHTVCDCSEKRNMAARYSFIINKYSWWWCEMLCMYVRTYIYIYLCLLVQCTGRETLWKIVSLYVFCYGEGGRYMGWGVALVSLYVNVGWWVRRVNTFGLKNHSPCATSRSAMCEFFFYFIFSRLLVLSSSEHVTQYTPPPLEFIYSPAAGDF